MRSPALGCCAALLLSSPMPAAAESRNQSATIVATATVAPRASIHVSARLLEFRVDQTSTDAVAVVEFTAAARVLPGDEVTMTVRPEAGLLGPGGAADVEAELTFSGDAPEVVPGTLRGGTAVMAARWSGGGVRRGRIVFRLRTAAPGTYTLPVSFAVSVP